jgi:hypothetical protein
VEHGILVLTSILSMTQKTIQRVKEGFVGYHIRSGVGSGVCVAEMQRVTSQRYLNTQDKT